MTSYLLIDTCSGAGVGFILDVLIIMPFVCTQYLHDLLMVHESCPEHIDTCVFLEA